MLGLGSSSYFLSGRVPTFIRLKGFPVRRFQGSPFSSFGLPTPHSAIRISPPGMSSSKFGFDLVDSAANGSAGEAR